MFLKTLLNFLDFSHLQQINLIKILFLTGVINFVDPSASNIIKNDLIYAGKLAISSEYCQYNICKKIEISDEEAETILNKSEFASLKSCYYWLNNIMQRKFFRGSRERHEVSDLFSDSKKLVSLLKTFDFTNEVKLKGYFDYIILPGSSEIFFRKKSLFLARLLNENIISTSEIYLITSKRLAYPYLEPIVENILAERLTKLNQKTFKDNLALVKKIFIKVAKEHLAQHHIKSDEKIENIRNIFRKNPSLFDVNLLIERITKEQNISSVIWPSETDVAINITKKMLKNYHIVIIETDNKIVNGQKVRANSKDGAIAWKNYMLDNEKKDLSQSNELQKKILLVSHQPKSLYQFLVFKNNLGKNYDIFMIASANYSKFNVSLLLSELAAFFEEAEKNILQKAD